MNYLSTPKLNAIKNKLDDITSISVNDRSEVLQIIMNEFNYDESKDEYYKHYYQVQKHKMDEDESKKEAYLKKQREKNKKWLSNEENKAKKKAYNREHYLRKKKEAKTIDSESLLKGRL